MDETLFATKPRTKKNVSARSNGTSGLEAASSLSGFYSGVSFLLLTLGFQLVIDSSSKGQHNRLVLVRCFAAHAWQSSGQLSMQLHCKHVCTRTMQVLFSSLPVPLVANASLQGNFFPLKKTSFFKFFFFPIFIIMFSFITRQHYQPSVPRHVLLHFQPPRQLLTCMLCS